jgi:hypothetical protein
VLPHQQAGEKVMPAPATTVSHPTPAPRKKARTSAGRLLS